MDGSLSLYIDAFDLWIKDKLDASIGNLSGNFAIHAEDSVITLDTPHGVSGTHLYFSRYLYLLGGFFSIQLDSIDTSAGGRLQIDDKNITYTNLDDAYRTINLQGLDIIIDGLIYLIMEELDFGLTGTDTTVSAYLSGNETTIYADFNHGASVTINTLWANILSFVEITLHSVELTAPTTITVEYVEEDILVTFNSSGDIGAGEFSVISFLGLGGLHLYGVDLKGSGTSISIRLPASGGIGFETDGAWQLHIDAIIILGQLRTDNLIVDKLNISFGGKGTFTLKGWGQLGALFGGPIYIEGSVSEYTTISLMLTAGMLEKLPQIFIKPNPGSYLVIEAEPGDFIFIFDSLSSKDLLFSSTSQVTIGIKDPLEHLIRDTSISVKGHFEFHNPVFDEELFSTSYLNAAGYFKLSRYKSISGNVIERYIVLNGNGSGYISSENGTGPFGVPKINFAGQWNDGYLTYIRSVEIFNDSTMAFMWLFHDVDFDVTILRGGVLQLIWQVLIGDGVGLWRQDINGDWHRLFPILHDPELPPSKGFATLVNGQTITTGTAEIIPGDKIEFDAWYVPANLTQGVVGASQGSQGQTVPGQQTNPVPELIPDQQNNQGQGAAPLDIGDEGYTFELDYGDGSSQTITVDYSEDPIKVDLGDHQYTGLGTYTVTLTVSDDPDADDVAVDTMTIDVVEKYLSVSSSLLLWDFEDVDEDGMIHDSFKVINKAHEIYSRGYVLNWSIIEDNLQWGNWTFEPSNGSLQPNTSQIVNVSFIPPEPGDYEIDTCSITVVNDDNIAENKHIGFGLNYGLIELFPSYVVLYMDTAGTRTLENVFWVHKTRWEKNDTALEWDICESDFDPSPDMITFIPDSGTIPNGQAPTAVDMLITASDGVYSGTVKVCRANDSADSGTVNITLIVGMSGQLDIDITHDDDRLFEGDPFIVNISDAKTGQRTPGATVKYKYYENDTVIATQTTDTNGQASFTAIDVPTDPGFIACKISVEAIGYDGADEIIWTHDTSTHIRGFVFDAVTHEQIGNARVEANPGGYVTYTIDVGVNPGYYGLTLSPGTYNITVSKVGYNPTIVEDIEATRGVYLFLDDIYLAPAGSGSHIMGCVYDNYNNPIIGATVSTPEDSDITDHTGRYYLTVTPGTHIVDVSAENYESDNATVVVNNGETVTRDFHLIPEGGLEAYFEGYVRDEITNQPIANANVHTSWNATSIVNTTTDETGYYHLTVVSGNNGGWGYYVHAEADGYNIEYEHVSWISGGEIITIDFYLEESYKKWTSPNGHVDNDWHNDLLGRPSEAKAYDGDTNTAATYRKNHGGWSQPLILLKTNPIDIKGFRINAKNEDHLDKMELKFYEGTTEKVSVTYDGLGSWLPHPYWQEGHFSGDVYTVDRVEIRFHLESGYTFGGLFDPHWAVVYEFDFWEVT